jgi:hypothetical protein
MSNIDRGFANDIQPVTAGSASDEAVTGAGVIPHRVAAYLMDDLALTGRSFPA